MNVELTNIFGEILVMKWSQAKSFTILFTTTCSVYFLIQTLNDVILTGSVSQKNVEFFGGMPKLFRKEDF